MGERERESGLLSAEEEGYERNDDELSRSSVPGGRLRAAQVLREPCSCRAASVEGELALGLGLAGHSERKQSFGDSLCSRAGGNIRCGGRPVASKHRDLVSAMVYSGRGG